MTPVLVRDQLAHLHQAISGHLIRGVIPFWADRARDADHGGFRTNFDAAGRSTGTPVKYLNTQCRLVWWFSQLHRQDAVVGWDTYARAGVDFLLQHLWDHQHGGFFWTCAADGSALDQGKVVYGQSFAIYALSAYHLATGDERGLRHAGAVFDLLQRQCADTRHGGYREYFDRAWQPERPGFAGGDRKTLDTHMHLMESFTTLYEASGDEVHRRKLLEVVDLIAARMIDPDNGCGLNQFDLAWRSVPALALKRTWNAERFGEQPAQPIETTSYGHNAELSWLMRLALVQAGTDQAPYDQAMRRLLDHTLAHGVDWEQGGIYRDGLRATGQAITLEKEFWQHAEALVGFLDGYQATGNQRYLDAFTTIWSFVDHWMIDHRLGEWRTLLSREGAPIDGALGNPWKVSYHTGRAMLECSARLAALQRTAP